MGVVLIGTRTHGGREGDTMCTHMGAAWTFTACCEISWLSGFFCVSKIDDAELGVIRGRWTLFEEPSLLRSANEVVATYV